MCEPNHHVGEIYFYPMGLAHGRPTAHRIVRCNPSETPGGSECFDYVAQCGDEALEWTMGGEFPVYCGTLKEAMEKGAEPCISCFCVTRKNQTIDDGKKFFVTKSTGGLIHKVVLSTPDETLDQSSPPSPCMEHVANCGLIGREHHEIADFYETFYDALAGNGYGPCPACMPDIAEKLRAKCPGE